MADEEKNNINMPDNGFQNSNDKNNSDTQFPDKGNFSGSTNKNSTPTVRPSNNGFQNQKNNNPFNKNNDMNKN